jgi:hypothetical protein
MKKITMIFTALAFVIGVAVISCTKESASIDPAVATATDAVTLDNTVADISGTVNDYQAVNPTVFADPITGLALKAGNADPVPPVPVSVDKCATVTYTKTPVLTGTAITGATITFKIDFGTVGCVSKDGKVRRGTITSNYIWVKEGGWTSTSTVNLYINDVHHVGNINATYGVTGTNKHAYIIDVAAMTVTSKDGKTVTSWTSTRQRELMEGNGGVNPVKEWKITGSSTFTNEKGEKSTFTIIEPLYTLANCKGFVAGSVTTTNAAGTSTTVNYGPFVSNALLKCKDGFTITVPPTTGKGGINTFIKWAI